MRVLIDIGHPAHVHFFKNLIEEMEKRGHETKVTAREKEITIYLLKKNKIGHENIGKHRKGIFNKLIGMPVFDLKLIKIAKKFNPDLFLSIASPYASQVSRLLGKKAVTFTDTEHAKIANFLTFPFSDKICTPSSFLDDLGPKQVRYDGCHELAYLHPKRFSPDSGVLKSLGLAEKDKFSVVRLVSWGASHDIGQSGFGKDRINAIKELEKHGRVFVTSEGPCPKELEKYRLRIKPEKMHDLLYYAQLYLGEGGTMALESAVLGTPAIHVSTTGKYCGVFRDLQDNYGLLYVFDKGEDGLKKAKKLLERKNLKKEWHKRREKMLKDKIDVTKWMVDFVESINSS